ncbi:MAG: 30S ribosomal protein S9 [Candidatus Magasanikbacteria bacterium]|nr:30S ribosomal protein S9 [Candidatus Magasanikbacteria bacterium]
MDKETGTENSFVRALGRRKTAAARVRLVPSGTGIITINDRPLKNYFTLFELQDAVRAPLRTVGKEDVFDISIRVAGGGIRGQAEAARHGIARALIKWNADLRKSLKAEGFLRRDPRAKERKKPGLKRARRAPQWSKR